MSLSIIITSINDPEQTLLTIASIRETAGDGPEIIVVDDCSSTSLIHWIKPQANLKLICNRYQCGCGPSRHIGALAASNDFLLFIDSHMRFTPGWFEIWHKDMMMLPMPFETVACATCLGLDSKHMDVSKPVMQYYGATMNFYGPDRGKPDKMQVFEAIWTPEADEPENGGELPAVMGACYFVAKAWFLKLGATRFLRSWGCDEQMLSLKSWLAGGECRMLKDVRIGHKFLIPGEHQGFKPPLGHVIWNKLFAVHTLCDFELATRFTEKLYFTHDRDVEAAQVRFKQDYHVVGQEIAYNADLLKYGVRWYADKFKLALP